MLLNAHMNGTWQYLTNFGLLVAIWVPCAFLNRSSCIHSAKYCKYVTASFLGCAGEILGISWSVLLPTCLAVLLNVIPNSLLIFPYRRRVLKKPTKVMNKWSESLHFGGPKERKRKAVARKKPAADPRVRSGQAPICFRCDQRADNCRSRGCVPYEYRPVPDRYKHLVTFLKEFNYADDSRRRLNDNDDNQVIVRWCHKQSSHVVMMQGLYLFQHYKRVRTWAYIQNSFAAEGIDYQKLERNLAVCMKKHEDVLYGDYNMHGCGFDKTDNDTILQVEMRGIRAVFRHQGWRDAIRTTHAGIRSCEQYEQIKAHFQSVRAPKKEGGVSGAMGIYVMKNMFDVLVILKVIPHQYITTYPVQPGGGTSEKLQYLYNSDSAGVKTLEVQLAELTHRLRAEGPEFRTDSHASIGACLCWWERKGRRAKGASASGNQSRHTEVLAKWRADVQWCVENGFDI